MLFQCSNIKKNKNTSTEASAIGYVATAKKNKYVIVSFCFVISISRANPIVYEEDVADNYVKMKNICKLQCKIQFKISTEYYRILFNPKKYGRTILYFQ